MLSVQVDTPAIAVATWRSLIVTVFRQNATVESLDAMARVEAALIAKVPRIFVLSVVPDMRVEVPSSAVRAKTDEITKRFAPALEATAIVIQGTGFGVAITRSMVTAATRLLEGRTSRVFDHVPPAIDWLIARPTQAFGLETHRAELDGAVRALAAGGVKIV